MALPALFESTRRPVGKVKATGSAEASKKAAALQPGLGGAPLPSKVLDFDMEQQSQTEWCWAAVSVSVSHFYDPGSTWTQCRVVNAELPQAGNCCQNGGTTACNQPHYLQRALTRTGNLNSPPTGASSYARVKAEINNGRPLGCRIGWIPEGGHFVVIYGYRDKKGAAGGTENWLEVADPWEDTLATLLYDDFRKRYQQAGRWTDSYTTRP